MDRCALFVDAGYLLADGAMAVHGTRNRDSVSWDYAGLVQLLNEVARDRTGLPLLRCYWYEATADGRRTQEQDGIADIPGIKFRAARIRPGRREGVESYVQRDLTTLARTGVLCEAVLVSGDEDMAQVVSDVQDLGVRVTVVHISVEGNWTISRALRRECDDLIEIGAGHLRPYVNLLSATGDESAETTTPLTNGRSHSGPEVTRRPVTAHTGASRVEPAVGNTGGMEAMFASTGAQQAMTGSAMDQLRAMRQSIAQQRGGDHLAPQGGTDSGRTNPSGPIDVNGFPSGGYAPPQRRRGEEPTGGQQSMMANPPTGPQPSFGATGGGPAGPAGPGGGTGAHPGMRDVVQNGYGGPAQGNGVPPGHPMGPHQQGPHQQGPHPAGPHQTGPHHDPMMGGGAQGYERGAPPGRGTPPPGPDPRDPRYRSHTGENPAYGGNTGPNPTYGASTETESGFSGSHGPRPGPGSGAGPRPEQPTAHGPYAPTPPGVGRVGPGAASAYSIDDAVNAARQEGNDFAESIARDAPTLWLEAVLASRPRMPSDLEARLLQGSALPIDFLLRDEVRDALRNGFWSALERARG